MHAIVVEVDVSGAEREEAIKRLREEVVPRVTQAPGFQSGTWLAPDEGAQGAAMIVFDTEDNARSAQNMVSVGSNPQPGVTVTKSEVRQVAATA